MGEIRRGLDRLAVELEDDVAGLQAGLVRGSTRRQIGHQRALGAFQSEGFRQAAIHVLYGHAQPAASHRARLAKLRHHVAQHIHRDRKREADRSPRPRGKNLRIHTDHFPIQVEQRPPGIARIDGDIGLDKGDVVLAAARRQAAALSADDTGGNRVVETERRADGQHPFTDLQVVIGAQLQEGQALGLNAQQRQIGARIKAYHFRVELAAVTQAHGDFRRLLNHVVVGHDKAIVAKQKPRARCVALGTVLRRYGQSKKAAQLLGNILLVERRFARLAGFDNDLHNGGAVLCHDVAKIRQFSRPNRARDQGQSQTRNKGQAADYTPGPGRVSGIGDCLHGKNSKLR